jgi:hypothetical protein
MWRVKVSRMYQLFSDPRLFHNMHPPLLLPRHTGSVAVLILILCAATSAFCFVPNTFSSSAIPIHAVNILFKSQPRHPN